MTDYSSYVIPWVWVLYENHGWDSKRKSGVVLRAPTFRAGHRPAPRKQVVEQVAGTWEEPLFLTLLVSIKRSVTEFHVKQFVQKNSPQCTIPIAGCHVNPRRVSQ